MDAFSSSPAMETFPDCPFGSASASPNMSPVPSPTKTEVDADFPVEMDESFNSSMSFCFNDSPPPPPSSLFLGKGAKKPPPSPSPMFRFPRPTGATKSQPAFNFTSKESSAASRRPLGPSRTFGQEITNNAGPSRQLFPVSTKTKMLPPALPEQPHFTTTAPSPVPLKSTLSQDCMGTPRQYFLMGRRDSAPAVESPARSRGDMMDVDSPAPSRISTQASPNVASPGFGQFFEESPAPAVVGTKRGFALSSPPGSPSSSPSITRRRGHDRSASMGGVMLGGVRANSQASRRPPYKRPPLQPLATASGHLPRASTASAYPIMNGPKIRHPSLPGMRRAFSLVNPNESDDESEMDASPSANCTNAEYQRRYGRVPRDAIDGSPGVKTIRTAVPNIPTEIKTAVEEMPNDFGSGGMFHYGAELENKILPCHSVRDDGLVRITAETLRDVLCGRYNDKITRYHVFDCRFQYEYDGGHIEGAVNVRNNAHLDELLLTPNSGVNAGPLPMPSVSGESDQRIVIIFHCEFSLKRAPTFAKDFRSRDRGLNLPPIYPKLHYPEVYILEGGYKSFFETSPAHCNPCAYVTMNDPKHAKRCDTDYAEFSLRHFGRARSYTFGDAQPFVTGGLMPPITLAAASAALGRRGSRVSGPTITEENEPDSSPLPNASPTPRAVSMGQAPLMFGSTKPRTFERSVLQRYASDAMVRL